MNELLTSRPDSRRAKEDYLYENMHTANFRRNYDSIYLTHDAQDRQTEPKTASP